MVRATFIFSAFACMFVVPALCADEVPLRQLIDQQIQKKTGTKNISMAPIADDATFLRRVFLDLVGTIPTYLETKQFLDNKDLKKREKLIDQLLDDPRYATHQANIWDLVMFTRDPPNRFATRERSGFKKWLRKTFADNEPYDKWVHELLMAEGNSVEQGAPLFYVQFRGNAEDTMVKVSRIFLGTPLQCARCHDHPHENWTQLDFYGMAAFFARLVVVDGKKTKAGQQYMIGEKRTGEVLFTGPAANQTPGQKGKPVGAKFLGGDTLVEPPLPKDFKEVKRLPRGKIPPRPDFSRKTKIADWVVSKQNPYFAKAIANRLWGQFLRRGLAHPVDNLSPTALISHAELLDILAEQMKKHNFDIKWFLRELLNSRTYQTASKGKVADPRYFEQFRFRPLSAEEMIASLRTATGFDDANRIAKIDPKKVRLPGNLGAYIMRYFGKPTDGKGNYQGNLAERLYLNNNYGVRSMIAAKKGNLADSILSSKEPWEKRVDQMYLTVLSRYPTAKERERFVAYITQATAPTATLVHEAIWVLVVSGEFRFNH